ncbi:MAG TPA: hypothetical protein H9717_10260 [Candidatus Eisenbergiella merdipullorum]|uniref:DUF6128 domain-containing protein n=1 Tax=Candidatus Eisenbergiella merdipullorum TaxID=2838553 RepID=A0A9D2L0B7_9FIRM|nr:hypothetical protein [Candidatus Eisenbergiella merdipullorum]
MFYYNRQIVYMDLWRSGERVRNAGFLKLEETDRKLRWQMRIQGLAESDTGFFDLRDETGALVDKLLLQKGSGSYERTFEPGAVTRGGRLFGEICGLKVELAGGRYLKGTWKLSGQAAAGAAAHMAVQKNAAAEKMSAHGSVVAEKTAAYGSAAAETGAGKVPEQETERTPETEKNERTSGPEETPAKPLPKAPVPKDPEQEAREHNEKREKPCGRKDRCLQAADTQTPPLDRTMRGTVPDGKENHMIRETLYEDKWEQLQHMYPCVHPFGDQRMFLSITPGDFVILGREYQKLVHNSFLLHGYYNYRHVILGRYPDGEEECYYLGVPGVYYEREKMAAEMFGFEAFEGKKEPAEQGDFGYYMKRVRI